jgi:hypothetical protein
MSLLAVPAILGWALAFARRVPGRPGAAIFFAISAVVSVLYVFACVGQLWLGAVLLFHAGNLALIALVVRHRADALRFLVSVPCVVFVFCAIAHWFLFSEAHYHFWDELAQWGLVTREIVSTHELYGLASNARRATAPPAAALWHYFVCANIGYSEGITYFAHWLLVIAPILPLYQGLSFRRPGWIVMVAALQLLLLANLGNGVASLFVDPLLSTFFAGILFVHLADPKSRTTLGLLALPLFVLTLLKESGVFFAASAALFVALSHLAHTARSPSDALRRLRGDRRIAALLCLVVLTPAVGVGSWQLRVALLEGDEPPRSVWGIGSRMLSPEDHEVDQSTLVARRFLEVFLSQPMSRSEASESRNAFNYSYMVWSERRDRPRLSTLGWLGFYALASGLALLCLRGGELRRSISLVTPYLLGIFGIYTLVLLRVYATDEGHGTLLSSYVRYMNTVLLPMILLSLAWFLPAMSSGRPGVRLRWRAPILLAALAALYAVETPYFEPLYAPRPHLDFRRLTEPWTDHIAAQIKPGRSLFVYVPRQYGSSARWALTYQLTPVPITLRSQLPDDEAVREALSHDYLWIFETTPDLAEKLPKTVAGASPEARAVYRVEHRPGGEVVLVKVLGIVQTDEVGASTSTSSPSYSRSRL